MVQSGTSTKDKVAPLLSSPIEPFSFQRSLSEQSTGSGTGEERTNFTTTAAIVNASMTLRNVVSFDERKKDRSFNSAIKDDSNEKHNDTRNDEIDDDDDDDNNDEDDIRILKGRERNREHARRTRLRKKAQLKELEIKYSTLLAEQQVLNQQLQDRNVASILLRLSSTIATAPPSCTDTVGPCGNSSISPSTGVVPIDDSIVIDKVCHDEQNVTSTSTTTIRRKRGFPHVDIPNCYIGSNNDTSSFSQPTPSLSIRINGVPTTINSKSHINWKTGIYCDEVGRQSHLTPEQLHDLRRERNRMHAKMTRDRKKCFISTMEKAIDELEHEVTNLRAQLNDNSISKPTTTGVDVSSVSHDTGMFTSTTVVDTNSNLVSPYLNAQPSPSPSPSSSCSVVGRSEDRSYVDQKEEEHQNKKTKNSLLVTCNHGFSLDGT